MVISDRAEIGVMEYVGDNRGRRLRRYPDVLAGLGVSVQVAKAELASHGVTVLAIHWETDKVAT